MKNNSGFSLVELIVVIAIMAILAGVAVPTYSKYIAKANDATVNAQLDEVKTAAFAVVAEKGKTLDTISIKVADGTIKVKDSDGTTTYDISTLFDGTIEFDDTSYSDATYVKWNDGTWSESATE